MIAENEVYCMDAIELAHAVADAGMQVDMIAADLPYGTTACSWDTVIPFAPMWEAFKRVIKPRGAIVLTASQPFTSALVMSNPAWFRYEWIWDKQAVTNIGAVKFQPLRTHESVLVFSEKPTVYYPQITGNATKPFGKTSATKSAVTGAFDVNYKVGVGYPKTVLAFMRPNNLTGGGFHPTQKPVALFSYLIRTYTQPGELVFDPTCGSGTTAVAALHTGRRYIVGDTSAEYCDIARQRLAEPYTPSFLDALAVSE